jgi:peptidyl-tRNA hydrolase, PTH2 family
VDGVVDFHNWLGYSLPKDFDEWVETGTTKICLQVQSEEELLSLYQAALKAGLEAYLVKDAGRTEFKGVETYTAVAIGPNQSEAIDKITGHLKLY